MRGRAGRLQRQLDGQDAVLVGGVGGVGVDLRAERDDAPERPALDLELLVDAVVGRRLGLAVAGEDELAAADLQLDCVRVDPGEVGADDRPRRIARVVDVDGGREAAAPARREAAIETSPNSSSISRRIRSKLAKRSRSCGIAVRWYLAQ